MPQNLPNVPCERGHFFFLAFIRRVILALGARQSRPIGVRDVNNQNQPPTAITIEQIIENAFEQAFTRALEGTLQNKAETLFKKAFEDGSPLAKKLEAKIEQGAALEWRSNVGTRYDVVIRPANGHIRRVNAMLGLFVPALVTPFDCYAL